MSQEEMVIKEANAVNDLIRGKVHYCFNNNAKYFSKYNKHSNKEIKKLFSHYNNLFQSMESFSEEEYNCVDCRDTVVKFWSFVLFDLWEREII
tara:strand:+ start:24851 stop:25129 length:279 start_codon:yes stop_codon:yes gene_type:complete